MIRKTAEVLNFFNLKNEVTNIQSVKPENNNPVMKSKSISIGFTINQTTLIRYKIINSDLIRAYEFCGLVD